MSREGLRRLAGVAVGALLALGPASLKADDGSARRPTTAPFVALQATGELVGPLVGTPDPEVISIWLPRGDRSFIGALRPNGGVWAFVQKTMGSIVFESSDCTGAPLIFDEGQAAMGIHTLFDAAGEGPGGVILGVDGPENLKVVASMWNIPDPGCNQIAVPFVMLVAPTALVLDPSTLALPLRLR